MRKIVGTFGESMLELSKEDIKNNPDKPQVRFYDDGELIGIFSLETLDVLYDNDMADYDVRFAKKEISRNRENWLETWEDYVKGIAHA
ncbi:hypothetical protein Hs20B_12460 [Lactococcus insecticola]|uniref:Uncharacterized protein n=1 Tax=Pseudolactococcus insecticola TaxID=2709158 RepID=A0A6A0B8Q8_9LACT|nr:hypothetical protein Hs20B_12460 [Lactococcus insecticola]